MLSKFLVNNFDGNVAPFAAIALFVIVVGVSLWITPRLAKWIDKRRKVIPGFYDGMHEQPVEDEEESRS